MTVGGILQVSTIRVLNADEREIVNLALHVLANAPKVMALGHDVRQRAQSMLDQKMYERLLWAVPTQG